MEANCSPLPMLQELFDRDADVFCDLPYQNRRNVSSLVNWNGCIPAIRVPELMVRSALSNLDEAERLKNAYDLAWLECRNPAHA
jgi:hypothetical protein